MRTLYLSLVILLTLSTDAFTQQPVTLPGDSVLYAMMKKFSIPALGVGVIENGKISSTKVLGELRKGIPAPDNTLFQVASLTKPLVEMTVLRLVSKKLWSLDEPLFHFWTDPDVVNDPRSKLLTTRHVIAHQSGFVNWRWLHSTGRLAFDFAPGTKTQYSGEGLEYLKKALEAKFKMTLVAIVKKYLFQPDGMNDTHFSWDGTFTEERYAVGHDQSGKSIEIRKNKEVSAADLLMTTISDYTVFAQNVLKKEQLSKSVWNDMIRVQGKDQDARFGLGWEVYHNLPHGEYALLHSGSDPGVRTIVVLFPKSARGIVIFTNSDNGMSIIRELISRSFDIGDELINTVSRTTVKVVYPDVEWEINNDVSKQGWNSDSLDNLRRFIIDSTAATGMVVVQSGKILFEYGDIKQTSYLASCRKSVLSMLYGPFVANKTINLSSTLEQLHIDDIGGLLSIEKKATINDLLTARSGVYHPASNEGDATDRAPKRGSIKPGSYWLYNNWDFNVAGYILEQQTGKTIYQLIDSVLAKPLQMQDWNINEQRKTGDLARSKYPAYHMWFSTRDMARIGYLMLREGKWKSEQVIPADWVKKTTSIVTSYNEASTANTAYFHFGYGYLWWIWDVPYENKYFEGAYSATGAFGQFITVLPKLDMVVAFKTRYEDGKQTPTGSYLTLLNRLIHSAHFP